MSICMCVHEHTHVCVKWHKAFGRVAGLLAHFVILIQCLVKTFCFILVFSPFRLQDIISQKKAEDKEEKDEPSRDKQHQALMDQRYFQVLTKRLVFTVNFGFNYSVTNYHLVRNTKKKKKERKQKKYLYPVFVCLACPVLPWYAYLAKSCLTLEKRLRPSSEQDE